MRFAGTVKIVLPLVRELNFEGQRGFQKRSRTAFVERFCNIKKRDRPREPRYTVEGYEGYIRELTGRFWVSMGRTTGGARDNTNSHTPDDPKGSADNYIGIV